MAGKEPKEPKEQKLTKEGLYSGFLVLLRYMSQYRRDIIILSVMGIVSAIGNGSIPYIAGKFFDALTNPGIFHFVMYAIPLYVAILSLWAVIQLITYTIDWRINIKSEFFSNAIWLDYLSNGFSFLLFLPMSFHL